MARLRIPQQYVLKVFKRYETHPKSRLKVKGFYTDERKRVRPIVEKVGQETKLHERREELRQKIEAQKKGLETQIILKPKRTRHGKPIQIDPIVKQKYREWLEASKRWRNRKILPIASLQAYYKSRQKAFVEQGGDPDVFEDKFSNIDMSVAVDGWLDLDQELKKHFVTPPKIEPPKTQSEVEELIREHEEEEKRLQQLYEEYVKSFEEQGAGLNVL